MAERYRMVYAGIRVRDLKRSINFYRKIMGMRVTRRGTSNNSDYASNIRLVVDGSIAILHLRRR